MKRFSFSLLLLAITPVLGCGFLNRTPQLAESKRFPVSVKANGIDGSLVLFEDSRFHASAEDRSGPMPMIDLKKIPAKMATLRLVDSKNVTIDEFQLSGARAELYSDQLGRLSAFRVSTTKFFGPAESLLDSDLYFFAVEDGHLKQILAKDEEGRSAPLVLKFTSTERYFTRGEQMFQIHCGALDTPGSVIHYDIYTVGLNGISKLARERPGICPRYGKFPDSQLPLK